MTKLEDNATLVISEQDLAVILTETFCGDYTPFGRMRVVSVDKDETDLFTLQFSPEDPAAA